MKIFKNMFKNFLKISRIEKEDRNFGNNERGFTLIELVATIGIMSLIMPLVVNLANIGLQSQKSSEIATGNILAYSGFDTILRSDMESANSIVVPAANNGKIVYIEVGDECRAWQVQGTGANNTLRYTTDYHGNKWVDFYGNVGSNTKFEFDGRVLSYTLELGEGTNMVTNVGQVVSKVYQRPGTVCGF